MSGQTGVTPGKVYTWFMTRYFSIGFALIAITFSAPSAAALYKCKDANGQISYQQQPCTSNNSSSEQIELDTQAGGSKPASSSVRGEWCTISIDGYTAAGYEIGSEPIHWQEKYGNGEVIQNPGEADEIWLKYAFKDDRLILRDYGDVRMVEYQILESKADELVLTTLYLAPDGKPSPDEYYVMKQGQCSDHVTQ